jgi:spore germination protein
MKNMNNYKMSSSELSILMISQIFGVGILIMPRAVAQEVGTADGWISMLLAGVLQIGIIFFCVRIQRHFPGQNFFEFIGKGKFGKWMTLLISIQFLVYLFLVTPFISRVAGLAVKMYLLDQTPVEVVIGSMLIIVFYAVSKGVQGIVHISLMFVPIILTVLMMGIVFNLGNVDLTIFLPILSEGISPLAKGVAPTLYSLIGVYILFFFLGTVKDTKIKAWPYYIGAIIVIFIHTLYFVIEVAVFSLEPLKTITFPTIELAKEIEVPGGFFERIESIFLTIWVMTVFTSLTINVILAQLLIKDVILKKEKMPWLSSVMAFILFILTFIPNSMVEVSKLGEWSAYMAIIATGSTLLFGWIAVMRKNKKQSKTSQAADM